MPKHLGVAAALAAFPVTGIFGVDKYYVGAWKLGLIQTILSILVFGLIISVPWMYLSTIVLIIAILWGGLPSLYPSVEWAPISSTDKLVAWIIIALYIIALISGMIAKQTEPYRNRKCKKCMKKKKNCKCK
jgi:hypothetical protein